jgi:hypothetical protein
MENNEHLIKALNSLRNGLSTAGYHIPSPTDKESVMNSLDDFDVHMVKFRQETPALLGLTRRGKLALVIAKFIETEKPGWSPNQLADAILKAGF